MRYNTTTLSVAIAIAFAAGLGASSLGRYAVSNARAETAPLAPAMIDLMAIKHGDLPTTPNPEMNSKRLVRSPDDSGERWYRNAPLSGLGTSRFIAAMDYTND